MQKAGRMLQIGVYHNDGVPRCRFEPGGRRYFLAEVAAEFEVLDLLVALGERFDDTPALISRPVVDENKFVAVLRDIGERRVERLRDERHVFRFVENGYHDGEEFLL